MADAMAKSEDERVGPSFLFDARPRNKFIFGKPAIILSHD
jgi:hypothetical protein